MRLRADQALTSIDLLHVLALITRAAGEKTIHEPLLLPAGQPRADLTIGELADFGDANRDAEPPRLVPIQEGGHDQTP